MNNANNQYMIAALDACSEYGVRCVEIWHSDGLKMKVRIETDGEYHEQTLLISPIAQFSEVKRTVTRWLDTLGIAP